MLHWHFNKKSKKFSANDKLHNIATHVNKLCKRSFQFQVHDKSDSQTISVLECKQAVLDAKA
jgi:uncharacterized FlaG/YvyC family protein